MKKVSFPRGVFPITPVERLLLVFCTVILLLVGTHCGQPDSSVTANLLLSPGGSWDAEQQFFQVLPIRMYVGDAHDARTLAISPYFRWTDKNGIVVEREGNQIRGTISSLKSPGTDSIVLSPYLGGNLMARSDIASNSVRVDLWVRVIIFSSDLRYLDDITSKTWINFWPATASQTVNVEYDHQVGYNVFGTTSEADTTIKLKISGAFTVADQKLIFNADQRNLAVESIFWDPDPTRRRGAFTLYVNVNRNQTASNPAYLVAVKNTTGNPVEKVAGYTLEPWTAQDHSTFMFVEYINHLSNPPFVEAVPSKVLKYS